MHSCQIPSAFPFNDSKSTGSQDCATVTMSVGTTHGTTYACSKTTTTTTARSMTEYLSVLRKMSVSLPTNPVAAHATAIDCGEISLPMTPPNRLADVVRTGLIPICVAVTCWSFPNSAADEVTHQVRQTPRHPITGETAGNALPV